MIGIPIWMAGVVVVVILGVVYFLISGRNSNSNWVSTNACQLLTSSLSLNLILPVCQRTKS